MINLFTDFPLDTVNVFFIFGAISGALYYSAFAVFSCLSALLSKEGINTLVKGRYKELICLLKTTKTLDNTTKFCDFIRSIFIFLIGVFLVILNYVFVNGIARIYLIIFLLLGVCLLKIIVRSKIYSVAIDLILSFAAFFLFAFFYPTKLIYRILTKKRMQNYSTPPI